MLFSAKFAWEYQAENVAALQNTFLYIKVWLWGDRKFLYERVTCRCVIAHVRLNGGKRSFWRATLRDRAANEGGSVKVFRIRHAQFGTCLQTYDKLTCADYSGFLLWTRLWYRILLWNFIGSSIGQIVFRTDIDVSKFIIWAKANFVEIIGTCILPPTYVMDCLLMRCWTANHSRYRYLGTRYLENYLN